MGHVPVRSCLACRHPAPKHHLVRVAVNDGSVVIDPGARLPGRGAYLCERPACLDAALAKGGARLARALRFPRGTITVNEETVRAGWRAAVAGPHLAHALPS
jgi:uncharacterized protein